MSILTEWIRSSDRSGQPSIDLLRNYRRSLKPRIRKRLGPGGDRMPRCQGACEISHQPRVPGLVVIKSSDVSKEVIWKLGNAEGENLPTFVWWFFTVQNKGYCWWLVYFTFDPPVFNLRNPVILRRGTIYSAHPSMCFLARMHTFMVLSWNWSCYSIGHLERSSILPVVIVKSVPLFA